MFKTLKEIWHSLETKEREYLKAGLYLILLLGGISIIFIPWALTREFWSIVDYKKTGAVGDTINGIAGPFIALIAAILTFLAFYIQYKANIQQKVQFTESLKKQNEYQNEQEHIWRKERFENRFYELLKLHRENVTENKLGEELGRKIFVVILREFRELLQIVKDLSVELNKTFTNEEVFIISYYALFYGVGPNSSRMFLKSLNYFDAQFITAFENKINNKEIKEVVKNKRAFTFTPFEGHQSRLGHYYRHLFQLISFVDNQTISIDKKEYVKTIRAQLSTHEQALLFINSLTPLGKIWWDKKLITEYRIVKNIPQGFFDKMREIDLESYFSADYFEYQVRT